MPCTGWFAAGDCQAAPNLRMCHVQVGDLGRSSVGGKGVPIDVRRGLRFQSPEAICSGTTSKVSPCITLHHNLLTITSSPLCSATPNHSPLTLVPYHKPPPNPFTTTSHHSPHQTPSPQHPYHSPLTTAPHHHPSPPALSTSVPGDQHSHQHFCLQQWPQMGTAASCFQTQM